MPSVEVLKPAQRGDHDDFLDGEMGSNRFLFYFR